ncbi:nitrate ABC transporter permease, partial [Streptomyces himastatinicus]|uniref:ABC transporter permease n=1 Tax=Streptomyces himastatinicus TaxID=998084 RepID=UPI0001B5038C
MTTVTAGTSATPRPGRHPGARPRRAAAGRLRAAGLYAVSVLAGVAVWQLLAVTYGSALVASPSETLSAARELAADGTLFNSVVASGRRILIGWGLGLAVGVPVGLLIGQIPLVRHLLDPYIEFFRFIPPVAFVTLAVVWLGIGESSK